MYKRLLVLISLVVINTALWAMDLNQTTTIINEAKEATSELQDEFNTILNEIPSQDAVRVEKQNPELNTSIKPMQINEIIEINTTLLKESTKVIEINETNEIDNKEQNTTIMLTKPILLIHQMETNKTNELNESVLIDSIPKIMPLTETNGSNLLSDINKSMCEEQNISMDSNESNFGTIAENGCTDIQGDSIKGLVIFKTRIKPYCNMNGETFAKQYMQEDWDDIFYDKEFKMEIIKACPKMETRYKDKWTPHLYQFSFDYASDSDAIPEC